MLAKNEIAHDAGMAVNDPAPPVRGTTLITPARRRIMLVLLCVI